MNLSWYTLQNQTWLVSNYYNHMSMALILLQRDLMASAVEPHGRVMKTTIITEP